MAYSSTKYQYETSPRKLKPEYERKRTRKSETSEQTKSKKQNGEKLKKAEKQEDLRKKQVEQEKLATGSQSGFKKHIKIISYILIAFAILFAISYRNSLITENFNKSENLKKQLSALQKENDQIKISIENNLNLAKIEKSATELLGMKKIDESQKVYVNLPKKDYVESASEQVIVEEKSWFEELIDGIMSFIK